MKIILMRHGQPILDLESLKGMKVSPLRVGEILEEYETTDLNLNILPPKEAITMASHCGIVITSDMPRAVMSVKLLGVAENTIFDATFREARLPYTKWQYPKLSFFTWAMIFSLSWLLGFSANGEPIKAAKLRANDCVAKLLALVEAHQTVLLLGHGMMNRLITQILKNKGWKITEQTGEKYWSYTIFEGEII